MTKGESQKGKKFRKITIRISEDKAQELIRNFEPRADGHHYYGSVYFDTNDQLRRQAVKTFPELLQLVSSYKQALLVDEELKRNPELMAKHKAIWDEYKPRMARIQKVIDTLQHQHSALYIEATAKSDAEFNAELVKAGIIGWGYKSGYIQRLEK